LKERQKEIEKQRQRRDKETIEMNPQLFFSFPINIFYEVSNMVEEQAPPPRRVLGDYAQGPRHFSSITIPATTKALEVKPAFLTLISTHQFTTMDHSVEPSGVQCFKESKPFEG